MSLFFSAILAGLTAVLTPCFFPALFVTLGLGGGQTKIRPFSVILGFLLAFGFVGPVVVFVPSVILRVVAGIVLIVLGAWVVVRSWRARGGPQEPTRDALPVGFVGGLALGSTFVPCVGAAFGTVLLLAQSGTYPFASHVLFSAWALGLGIPVLFFTHLLNDLFHHFWKSHPQSHFFPILLGTLVILHGWIVVFGLTTPVLTALLPISPFASFAL